MKKFLCVLALMLLASIPSVAQRINDKGQKMVKEIMFIPYRDDEPQYWKKYEFGYNDQNRLATFRFYTKLPKHEEYDEPEWDGQWHLKEEYIHEGMSLVRHSHNSESVQYEYDLDTEWRVARLTETIKHSKDGALERYVYSYHYGFQNKEKGYRLVRSSWREWFRRPHHTCWYLQTAEGATRYWYEDGCRMEVSDYNKPIPEKELDGARNAAYELQDPEHINDTNMDLGRFFRSEGDYGNDITFTEWIPKTGDYLPKRDDKWTRYVYRYDDAGNLIEMRHIYRQDPATDDWRLKELIKISYVE